MAAYHAAAAGLDVLLLEKHNQIGVPLCCGEAVSQSGLEELVDVKQSWIATSIEGVDVFGPQDSSLTIRHPRAGYILERKLFDRDLAMMAAAKGAQIRIGSEAVGLIPGDNGYRGVIVEELGERREYLAELIIAADGIESVIGRLAGVGKPIPLKLYNTATQFLVCGIDIPPDWIEFHFDPDQYPGGYLWVFPKSRHAANVGVGLVMIDRKGVSQADLLIRFCQKRFSRFTIAERSSGGIPIFQGKHHLLKENIMLVGDAARVVDSFSGAGIVNGMLSGKIAGETAAAYCYDGHSLAQLKSYPRQFMKLKGRELSIYLKAHKLMSRLKPDDLVSAIQFLKGYFPDGYTTSINGVHLALKLMRHNPRFILLSKGLVFA